MNAPLDGNQPIPDDEPQGDPKQAQVVKDNENKRLTFQSDCPFCDKETHNVTTTDAKGYVIGIVEVCGECGWTCS